MHSRSSFSSHAAGSSAVANHRLSTQLPEVAAGRQQIVDLWVGSFDRISSGDLIDRESMDDAIFGALQLGFNSHETSFVQACVVRASRLH